MRKSKKLVKRPLSAIANALCVAFLTIAAAPTQAPAQMIMRSPTTDASVQHDETAGDQMFATQQWWVQDRNKKGSTVIFATDQAFTHLEDGTFKRDAALGLAIGSSSKSAKWKVAVASDRTNHAAKDETASVQAKSRKAGWARLDLTVTFITEETDTLAAGDYTLTITGTMTSN